MLTERTAQILAHVVGEYIDTALPVGSHTVVDKYHLPVSAATVRKEMAKLEEEGYITHPHTSAGRIPSDRGYRYYVESLMEEEVLPRQVERFIEQRFSALGRLAFARLDSLDEWVRLAVSIIAESVQNAAVATAPRVSRCRLQHLEIVSLDDNRALLIAVFYGARIRQRVFSFAGAADQDELIRVAHSVTAACQGLTAAQIEAVGPSLSGMESDVAAMAAGLMEAEEETQFEQAHLDGMMHIFNQPEFAQMDAVLEMVSTLHEENIPRAIPFDSLAGEDVTVVIGAENHEDRMRRCSIVLTRYGAPGGARGALAVVGPTRMRYSFVIPTIRYLSSLMGAQVAELC